MGLMRSLFRFKYTLERAQRVGVRKVQKSIFGKVGKNVQYDPASTFMHADKIEIGDDVFIGSGAILSAVAGLKFGRGAMIGPDLIVMGGDHRFDQVGVRMRDQHAPGQNVPIEIGDDCWLGVRVTILKGGNIGEGAIIGAGSVVTKPIPPYTIAVGNPCRPRNTRFTDAQLREHLPSVGSTLNADDVIRQWREAGLRS